MIKTLKFDNEYYQQQRKKGRELRKQHLHLTEYQLQITYGGLLGDSSLTPRSNGQCRLKMSHGEKQKEYLEFKKKIMEPFIIQESATKDISKRDNTDAFGSLPTYHYNSIVHQDFTNLYGLFYRKEKGIKRRYLNMNILNLLQPIAILIWYLDDGNYFYSKKKGAKMYISTYSYPLSEHKMLAKWFWHTWRIESKITYDKTHNNYYIRFNKEAIIKFSETFLFPFKDIIPNCMLYKLPKF